MENKSKTKEIMEWVYCIVIAVIIVLLIKTFIGVPTVVKQESMYPTLKQNERLWLNKWEANFNKLPKRGEVITFEAPNTAKGTTALDLNHVDLSNPVAPYEYEPGNIITKFIYNVLEIGKVSYIKRVIGLPGEHVEIKEGAVYINGEKLQEDYLQDTVITESMGGLYTDIVVPENCVYVLGDNRPGSKDSRFFGCIPVKKIESVAVCRFWPLNKIGGLVAK